MAYRLVNCGFLPKENIYLRKAWGKRRTVNWRPAGMGIGRINSSGQRIQKGLIPL